MYLDDKMTDINYLVNKSNHGNRIKNVYITIAQLL